MNSAADVVIVGGGSCGSVLAARLSDRPGVSVHLLEAGPSFGSAAPPGVLDATVLPVGPASDWVRRYPAQLTNELTGEIVRGRLLGGSGAVNGCYFVRGRPADFAAWPASWSWEAVRRCYRRLETDHDFGGPSHGHNGPMSVRRQYGDDLAPISVEFGAAAAALGFPDELDKNGENAEGVGPVPLNIDGEGRRMSTAVAYLSGLEQRRNLLVDTETMVTRILFDGDAAVGVESVRHGLRSATYAGMVVLSCGAIESAALLLRSGVGDPDRLRMAGVEPLHERSGVGAGFSDHLEVAVPYQLDEKYCSTRRFVPLQTVLNIGGIEIRPYTRPLGSLVPGSGIEVPYLGVSLMVPRSRGRIDLASADPGAAPRIDYRYLSDPTDREHIDAGTEIARELLRHLESRRVVNVVSGDTRLGTSQHMMGTCRMGARDDELAVVDERCGVHGLAGLSVVDASIIPVPLSRGTHATAVMLAERASDLLV